MPFVWAQLGLLQAWLLPGLAITVRRRELPPVDRLLLAFPISAAANYLLIEALTLVGAYHRLTILIVIVVEVCAIGWSLRRQMTIDPALVAAERVQTPPVAAGFLRDAIFAGLFIAVGFEVLAGASIQVGKIFTEWDSVMSWNRWAGEWFHGRFPADTQHYPQLLPALMSLPYVMVRDVRVQQFAKLATLAIPPLMVATGFRLSLYTGRYRHLFAMAAAIAAWRFVALLGSTQPYDGMADVPAAYMVLAAAYGFVLAYHAESEPSRAAIVTLASFVLGGAMLTKQAGLFAIGLPIVWALFMRDLGVSVGRRLLIRSFAILAVVAGHWYAITEIGIRFGRNGSEIGHVTSIVQLPWTAKLARGWMLLWGNRIAVAALAALATVAAATHHVGRRILLFGVLPVFLSWALWFSYDARNFAVGVIPLACCIVFGVVQIAQWTSVPGRSRGTDSVLRTGVIAAAILLVIAGDVLVARRYNINRMTERADAQKRKLGEADLNEFLYAVLPTLPAGEVGTSYQYLGHLPGLENRFVMVDCDTEMEISRAITAAHPRYYLWLPERCSDLINRRIEEARRGQSLVSVGQHGTRVLFRVDSLERVLKILRP